MDKPLPLDYHPDYAVSPGEVLSDELEFRQMSHRELANQCGMTIDDIAALIDGRSIVTEETAHQLERAFGMPAQLWLNLESLFQERSARVKTG